MDIESIHSVCEKESNLLGSFCKNVINRIISKSIISENTCFHSDQVESTAGGIVEWKIRSTDESSREKCNRGTSIVIRAIIAYYVSIRIGTESCKNAGECFYIGFFIISHVIVIDRFMWLIFPHKKKLEEFSCVVFVWIFWIVLIEEIKVCSFRIITRISIIEQESLHEGLIIREHVLEKEIVLFKNILCRYLCSIRSNGINILEKSEKFALRFIGVFVEDELIET